MRPSLFRVARAAIAALVAVALVIPAAADKNDKLGPSDTRRRDMIATTSGAEVCKKNTDRFTDYQYTWYIMTALREIGMILMTRATLEGTDGSPGEQLDRMMGELISLSQCQFDSHAQRAGRFALAGCISLKNQMWALDDEANYLVKKSRISPHDKVDGIEKLLPAVQACRDKLGKCYNPNNKQQAEWATSLFAFETYVRDISENQSRLELHLPACSKSMLEAGDDKPKPGDQRSITYLDTAMDWLDFWDGTPGAGNK